MLDSQISLGLKYRPRVKIKIVILSVFIRKKNNLVKKYADKHVGNNVNLEKKKKINNNIVIVDARLAQLSFISRDKQRILTKVFVG